MQPSTRLMRHILGLGLSTLLMVGCQDMLGNGQREATNTQATEQDLQVTAQQGISEETKTTEPAKTDKVVANDIKPAEELPSCEPKVTEEKPVEKPTEEPKKIEEHPVAFDTLAMCKELDFQLNSEAVHKDAELHMALKQKHIALNCFQVIGDATPTIPPKEPTQEENCLTLKNLIASVGTDNPKYSYYVEMYQAHCTETKSVDAPISTEPKVIEEKPVEKPADAPKVSEEHHDGLDTVGVCKELHAKMNTKEVFDNVELYMQIKNQFGELNCFALIGNPQPITPPKELTQEEICHNLKSSMELLATLGTEPVKLESYKVEYQAHCVAH